MNSLCTIAFAFLVINSFSQEETIRIQGKVVDSQAGALAYANVYLKGKSIGTVTNDLGEFDFRAPASCMHDTLIISYVGYKSYESELLKIEAAVFRLESYPTQLQEIEVRDISPESIMRKALASIGKNYPVEPYLLKGFYRDWKVRESIDPDSSKVSLIEAAVAIYDKGYKNAQKRSSREEVFLEEIRRTKAPGTMYNYLYLLLEQNYVRHNWSRNLGNVYSPFDFYHLTEYKIEDVLSQEAGNVYLISANLPSKLGRYHFYVTAKDFVFLRIDFKGQMSSDEVLGEDPMPWIKKTHQLIFVDNTLGFRKYSDRYFPNYLKLNWKTHTLYDSTRQITDTREFSQELLINEIITENVESLKKTLLFPMALTTSLEKQVRPYHSAFWEKFNIVKEKPLEARLKKLLEKNEKIEEQFLNQKADSSMNGKNLKVKKSSTRKSAK